MIISENGYSINEDIKHNRIVISLPQTMTTLTNTASDISDRNDRLSDIDLLTILAVVEDLYKK